MYLLYILVAENQLNRTQLVIANAGMPCSVLIEKFPYTEGGLVYPSTYDIVVHKKILKVV